MKNWVEYRIVGNGPYSLIKNTWNETDTTYIQSDDELLGTFDDIFDAVRARCKVSQEDAGFVY